jgi:putative nucleotidyltransferase with HDIG domain
MLETPRIMFVGEDQELWPQLLRSSGSERWRMTFAHTADEALVALDEQGFDAVVANLSLRGMSGPEFLHEVRQRRPEIWRFLRAEAKATHEATGWAGAAHQLIDVPDDVDAIQSRLAKAFRSEFWMPSPIAQNLLTLCPVLPSPPKLYHRILDALSSEGASLEKIGELIEEDPPMSAKILKLVNSAVFALQMDVTRASDAVMYLGLETTKAMILLAHSVSSFQAAERAEFSMDQLVRHSVTTARFARWISQVECPRGQTPDQAFTAGLLHDVGQFLLAANRSEAFARTIQHARKMKVPLRRAEIDFFGVDHAELGAALLASWGLPQPVVEAVALHHAPRWLGEPNFCATTAVHAGNVIASNEETNHGLERPQIDQAYLDAGGYGESLEGWRQSCIFRE